MQSTVLQAKDGKLILDKSASKWLGSQKELVAIIEGDSMIIKRRRSLLDLAQPSVKTAMPMKEVCKEVHKARRAK